MKIDLDGIYNVTAAGKAVGLGETFMRREIREGRLVARRVGKRVLRIKGTDLQAWYDAWTTTTASNDGSQCDGTSSQ